MAILELPQLLVGQNNIYPTRRPMIVTDSYATITTPGYLNNLSIPSSFALSTNDVLWLQYNCNMDGSGGTFGIFSITVSGTVYTLVPLAVPGSVSATLPTTVGHIATYSNTTGNITEDPATAITNGNLQVGSNGVAGAVTCYPAVANNGTLSLVPALNTNGAAFSITNTNSTALGGPTCQYVLPPILTANTNFIVSNGIQSMGAFSCLYTDKGSATASGGIFTLNNQSGFLTTASLSLTQYSSVSLTMNNSLIQTNSVVFPQVSGGTNTTAGVTLSTQSQTLGSVVIKITNLNTAALNGTIVMSFVIL